MAFENKTVIVTGASVGIGKAAALEFASLGANVVMVDIAEETLLSARAEVEALGGAVSAFVCDVSDEARVSAVCAETAAVYGGIDILVNNAGLWRYFSPFAETDSAFWQKLFAVNVFGLMHFTRQALGYMLEKGYGRIINIGSVAGTYGNKNMAVYSATKGAVSSFTKALAKEVADRGITVNNVVPGSVRNEGAKAETDLCYMGRTGELEEYAHLICFLAGDKAAYISGQDYRIDGCRKKI